MHPASCPRQPEWIQDVLRGMEHRMGYDTQANHAVPVDALVMLMNYIRKDAEECSNNWKPTSYGKLVHSFV